MKYWLAIADSAYRAYDFGRESGELVGKFILLDSARGICDKSAFGSGWSRYIQTAVGNSTPKRSQL